MGSPAFRRSIVVRPSSICIPFLWSILAASIVFPSPALAQSAVKRRLITAPIQDESTTTLRGNTYPLARAEFDRGAAPLDLPMRRMLLVLKRGPEQETSLEGLLDQQQAKGSPSYHSWLTPEQFGQQFGPADEDIQEITSWLQSHGFAVTRVSTGRTVIEFSGTASQVQNAFHTEIHEYVVNGVERWANASDPAIPSALSAAVAGIDTLHNFPRKWLHHSGGLYTKSKETGRVKPVALTPGPSSLFTLSAPNGCGVQPANCYALGPYDFGTIYDALPLWNATPTHIDGTGQTIAVVAESNINTQDVTSFRTFFGLSTPAKLNVIVSGPDPGLDPGGAETEADLDVEWAGAIAPNSTIDLVVSQSTESSLGADLSAVYVVDNNLAPVMNVSFGICELDLGTTGNQFFNQLWQQAAAQGITVLVATGDSGSAVCDRDDGTAPAPAKLGLTVSGFSSTPYNVAVGGTDFNDLIDASTYWNLTNSAPSNNPTAIPTVSAKSYIPETTWNDSCTNGVFGSLLGYSTNAEANCNNPNLVNFVTSVGGSGGESNCIVSDGQSVSSCEGGYAKPSWQVGAGVPNDPGRNVPDVSLFSAVNSPSGSFYIICEADLVPTGSTSCDPSDPSTEFLSIGGTSASSPSFAAIMALVNQETNSRQGNANYTLYKLNAQVPTAFHDVTVGGTIAMPCAKGSPDCTVTNPADAYGVLSGYSTTAGYDLATGLGSVNANTLVTKWSTVTTLGSLTTLSLTPSPVNITHGHSVNVAVNVTPAPGAAGTPTGYASLIAGTGSSGQSGVESYSLTDGNASGTTNALPGGTYAVTAHYPGDGTFSSSNSAPVSVTVAPEASKVQIVYELFNPTTGLQTSPNATSAQYGSLGILRTNVTSNSGDTCAQNAPGELGCPTGSVTVTNNGTALDGGTYNLNSLGYTEDQNIQLPGGTDNIQAAYGGDSSFTANTGTTTITITKAPTTISASGPSSPEIYHNTIQLGAVISSVGLGAGPTGQVTFFSGTTPVSTPAPLTQSMPGSFNSNPQAEVLVQTSQLALGNNTLTGQYSGDGNYAASTSLPFVVDMQIPATCSIVSSNPTIAHGSSVTFTAQVTPTQTGGPGPTGSIVFNDGFTNFATVPLTNGMAQTTTSSLPGGNLQIAASYNGDPNYSLCSNSVNETVNLLQTTTTVTTSNPAIQQGQTVILTAVVAPVQPGGPSLTGMVGFFATNSPNGSDTQIGNLVPLSNGQAQITTSALPANTQIVYAGYSGDSNYATSTGSAAQTVTPAPTFSISANPAAVTISSPGGSASTTLTFTSMYGLTGTFSLVPQCTYLPALTTCSVSPSSITLSSTATTATATLTFKTTGSSTSAPGLQNRPAPPRTGTLITLSLLILLPVLALMLMRKHRRIQFAVSLLVFAGLLTIASCGGGGSSSSGGGGGGGGGTGGTPVGIDQSATASFTLGAVTQSVGISINVE